MTNLSKFIFVFSITLILFACKDNSVIDKSTIYIENGSNYKVIADTIISDVVIKNPDNDEWTDYCLRNLDKKILVNELFDLVYSKKLTPYDFFLETPMTIEEVKAIEEDPEYDRDNIGKVQFEESWNFDFENHKMMKKVHSIMLAYEVFDNDNKVKAYKPVFKVYFNSDTIHE